jgi:hypothetical protein
MQLLTPDPLAEIVRKFDNPLDILAFELSSKKNQYVVQKYDLYREWEKRLMPNDDYRIMATDICSSVPVFIEFSFNRKKVVTFIMDGSYRGFGIKMDVRRNLNSNFKLPQINYSVLLDYKLVQYIYRLLEMGMDFKWLIFTKENFGERFGIAESGNLKSLYENVRYPNERYRILATYAAFLNESILFRKGKKTLTFKDASIAYKEHIGIIHMIYKMLEDGWIIRVKDEEDRNRVIREHLLF